MTKEECQEQVAKVICDKSDEITCDECFRLSNGHICEGLDHCRISEKTEELPQNGSSFFTRLLAAMLLLALFLQFHLSGSSIFGYNSREAVTAVSQSIDLQKVADSVRIK